MEKERETLLNDFEDRKSEDGSKLKRTVVSSPFRVDIKTRKMFGWREGDQMNTNKENLFQADSLFRKQNKQ
jgi:hypothetical protein